jgi:hypothetical protein
LDLLTSDVLDEVVKVLVGAVLPPLLVRIGATVGRLLGKWRRRPHVVDCTGTQVTLEEREQARQVVGPVLSAFALPEAAQQALLAALVDRLAGRLDGGARQP